jgi:hypothetical protein
MYHHLSGSTAEGLIWYNEASEIEPGSRRVLSSVRLESTESTSSVVSHVVNAHTSPLRKRAPADLKQDAQREACESGQRPRPHTRARAESSGPDEASSRAAASRPLGQHGQPHPPKRLDYQAQRLVGVTSAAARAAQPGRPE